MKKIIIIIAIFFSIFTPAFTYELTKQDEKIIENIDNRAFKMIDSKKIAAEKLSKFLINYADKKTKDKRLQEIIYTIANDIEYKYEVGEYAEDNTAIDKPRVRFVILNTKDVNITKDIKKRVRDIGEYIENYYIKELKSKGYRLNNTNMFARNKNGDILVYVVKSPQSSSEISNITSTAINLAKSKYTDLTDTNTVWSIVHFKNKGGFLGGGKINKASMRFELKNIDGSIDFTKNMSETDYHKDISLKAIHHELGHALTLLHNGPLRTNITFNTLMGPINRTYEKTVGITQTKNIHLSDYSASIIAYHPIFRDKAFNSNQLTRKTIRINKIMRDDDLFTIDCSTGIAHIRGKVISNLPFHSVVIRLTYDNLESKGYWNKSFALSPNSDGIFDLKLTKNDINIGTTKKNDFKYEVMVAFDNGLTTGVNQLNTNKAITINKNKYINSYSFSCK